MGRSGENDNAALVGGPRHKNYEIRLLKKITFFRGVFVERSNDI